MPKVSFRMASASGESVFGVQTNTARKIHRSDHTEGRLTTAKRMLRTEGNGGRDGPNDAAAPERVLASPTLGCAVRPVRFKVPRVPVAERMRQFVKQRWWSGRATVKRRTCSRRA